MGRKSANYRISGHKDPTMGDENKQTQSSNRLTVGVITVSNNIINNLGIEERDKYGSGFCVDFQNLNQNGDLGGFNNRTKHYDTWFCGIMERSGIWKF